MFKNFVLISSLLLNALAAYSIFSSPTSDGPKMSCEQARDEGLNKEVTQAFAKGNNNSFAKTHRYLRNSDYSIRNIWTSAEGAVTFVYTAHSYPKTCGLHFPSINGSIVRVLTNVSADPQIIDVN